MNRRFASASLAGARRTTWRSTRLRSSLPVLGRVKPDLIIETGIAHGGSLILSASILALVDYAEAAECGKALFPGKPKRTVLGVDVDIRVHNRQAIEAHAMASSIEMI